MASRPISSSSAQRLSQVPEEASTASPTSPQLLQRLDELLATQASMQAQLNALQEEQRQEQFQQRMSLMRAPSKGVSGRSGSKDSVAEHTQRIHFSGKHVTANSDEETFSNVEALPSDWPMCSQVRSFNRPGKDSEELAMLSAPSPKLAQVHPVAEKPAPFTIAPTSATRLFLDFLGMVMFCYDLFLLPVIIAWEFPLRGFFLVAQIIVAVFWTLDIGFTLRTSYYNETGELEQRSDKIFLRYLKTMLIPDIIFVVLDWIAIGVAEARPDATAIHLLRILRFLKVWRILRIAETLERLTYKIDIPDWIQNVLSLGTVLFGLIWLCHIVACWFWAIGSGLFSSDTGHNWLDDGGGDVFKEFPFSYQYTTALHFAVGNLGTGMEIAPRNTSERIFTMIANLINMLFFAWFVGSLFAALWNFRQRQAEKNEKMQEIRKFLRQSKISTKTSLLVQRHAYDLLSVEKPVTIADVSALSLLPQTLRSEIQAEMCAPHVFRVDFFRLLRYLDSDIFNALLVGCIDFSISSDVVFNAGAKAATCYIIDFGKVEYVQLPGFSKHAHRVTKTVGSGELLSEPALWVQWTHVGTASALGHTSMLAINVEKLSILLGSQPNTRKVASEYARGYQLRLSLAFPPHAPWPDDVEVASTSSDEIISSCSPEVRVIVSVLALDLLKHGQPLDVLSHLSELFTPSPQRSWPTNTGELMREVEEDQCVLKITEASDVERLLAIAELKVKRSGGQILAELGSWDDEVGLLVGCKLPGSKQRGGETPLQTIRRMISEDLKSLERNIDLRTAIPVLSATCWHNEKTNLRTRYLQTVYTASYSETKDYNSEIIWMKPQLHGKPDAVERGNTGNLDIFGLVGKDRRLVLYAWLTPREFESFIDSNGSKAGRDRLRRELGLLELSEDVKQRISKGPVVPQSSTKKSFSRFAANDELLGFSGAGASSMWQCLVL